MTFSTSPTNCPRLWTEFFIIAQLSHPSSSSFPSVSISTQLRQMKVGMGGAVDGMINSILITDGNRYTYGLIVIKITVQYALLLLQNGRAKLC